MDFSRVFVVTGPTAVGKGTILRALMERYPQLWLSVSATTREPRPGEIEGVHYYFVSEKKFDELLASNQMLEWARVHKKYRYGTPRQPVIDALDHGCVVILELDVEGSRQVRRSMPQATHVFIAPPTWDALVQRLHGRGTEDSDEQKRRLQTAQQELAAQSEFDVVIVNDTLDQAVDDLARVMHLA